MHLHRKIQTMQIAKTNKIMENLIKSNNKY